MDMLNMMESSTKLLLTYMDKILCQPPLKPKEVVALHNHFHNHPQVVLIALTRTAEGNTSDFYTDVTSKVSHYFYVNDCLTPTVSKEDYSNCKELDCALLSQF